MDEKSPRDNPLESKDSQNSLADGQIRVKVEHVLKQYVNILSLNYLPEKICVGCSSST